MTINFCPYEAIEKELGFISISILDGIQYINYKKIKNPNVKKEINAGKNPDKKW